MLYSRSSTRSCSSLVVVLFQEQVVENPVASQNLSNEKPNSRRELVGLAHECICSDVHVCLDSNYARGVPNTYIHIPTTYLPTYLPAPLPTSPPTKECTYAHTYMPTYGNMHTYVQPIAIHAHTWSGVLHSRAPPLVWSGGGPRGRGGVGALAPKLQLEGRPKITDKASIVRKP